MFNVGDRVKVKDVFFSGATHTTLNQVGTIVSNAGGGIFQYSVIFNHLLNGYGRPLEQVYAGKQLILANTQKLIKII